MGCFLVVTCLLWNGHQNICVGEKGKCGARADTLELSWYWEVGMNPNYSAMARTTSQEISKRCTTFAIDGVSPRFADGHRGRAGQPARTTPGSGGQIGFTRAIVIEALS